MQKRTALISVATAVVAGIFLGAFFWPNNPEPERLEFSGGGKSERAAVGKMITLIRDGDAGGLVRLDREPSYYSEEDAPRRGSEWLVQNRAKFSGIVHAKIMKGENSVTDFIACLTSGDKKVLFVMGYRATEYDPFKILVGSYASADSAPFREGTQSACDRGTG